LEERKGRREDAGLAEVDPSFRNSEKVLGEGGERKEQVGAPGVEAASARAGGPGLWPSGRWELQ
jgi:hypothetical protein